MLSVTTWVALICCSLPFTITCAPGGLPITIDTGFFSAQVRLWPAGTTTWESDWRGGLLTPTQQSDLAVNWITASPFGTAGGAVCVAGAIVGVGVATGLTLAVAVAAGCELRVEM